ncbi:MAG: hypothetical protein ACTSSP_09130 [Candidatus Asgardarchaeia archaeon]
MSSSNNAFYIWKALIEKAIIESLPSIEIFGEPFSIINENTLTKENKIILFKGKKLILRDLNKNYELAIDLNRATEEVLWSTLLIFIRN